MTTDEIIAMARDVGMCGMLTDVVCTIDELERFAALVAAKEREACAQVCDHYAHAKDYGGNTYMRSQDCKNAATAIRARCAKLEGKT